MTGWDNFLRGFGMLLGRIAFSFIFLSAGYKHARNIDGVLEGMAAQMPFSPFVLKILLWSAIVCLAVGGLSVLFGFFTRFGASLLILFLVVVTYFYHDFWNMPPEQLQQQSTQFLKNISLLGGALMLMGYGPGLWSLDMLRSKGE